MADHTDTEITDFGIITLECLDSVLLYLTGSDWHSFRSSVCHVWGFAVFWTIFVVVLIAIGLILWKYFHITNYVILSYVKEFEDFLH